jgi:hypothetical protein
MWGTTGIAYIAIEHKIPYKNHYLTRESANLEDLLLKGGLINKGRIDADFEGENVKLIYRRC